MSTQQAMANADNELTRELADAMRTEQHRQQAARAQVRKAASISADTSSRSMRHASSKALDELEARREAYLEDIATKHTSEDERLKQQARELDRRIDDMQQALAALIEQRGDTDRAIKDEREGYQQARRDCERKFAVLISSQRQVIAAIDGLGDNVA
ncbi:hypothetical protein [Synechococcus phage Ssp-JY38]|nr:hypothetical protein [Synechococcus phage Yong-L2-223]